MESSEGWAGVEPPPSEVEEGGQSKTPGQFTCLACREARIYCEKVIPCARCVRLGLDCVAQLRGRGRPRGNVKTKGRRQRQREGRPDEEEERYNVAMFSSVKTDDGQTSGSDNAGGGSSPEHSSPEHSAPFAMSRCRPTSTVLAASAAQGPHPPPHHHHHHQPPPSDAVVLAAPPPPQLALLRPPAAQADNGLAKAYDVCASVLRRLLDQNAVDLNKAGLFRDGLHLHFDVYSGFKFSGEPVLEMLERCRSHFLIESRGGRIPRAPLPGDLGAQTESAADSAWVVSLLSSCPDGLTMYLRSSLQGSRSDRQVWCNARMSEHVITSKELCAATLQMRTTIMHVLTRILCSSTQDGFFAALTEAMFSPGRSERSLVVKVLDRGLRPLRCLATIRSILHIFPGDTETAIRFLPLQDLVTFGKEWVEVSEPVKASEPDPGQWGAVVDGALASDETAEETTTTTSTQQQQQQQQQQQRRRPREAEEEGGGGNKILAILQRQGGTTRPPAAAVSSSSSSSSSSSFASSSYPAPSEAAWSVEAMEETELSAQLARPMDIDEEQEESAAVAGLLGGDEEGDFMTLLDRLGPLFSQLDGEQQQQRQLQQQPQQPW